MLTSAPKKRRGRLRHKKTEPRTTLCEIIRNTARELFAREGYENVSMRRIAAEIGCSPMAMYRHFENKDELLLSICEDTFRGMIKLIDAEREKSQPPLQRLRRSMKTMIEFHVSHPNHYRVTFLMEMPSVRMAERKAAIGRPVVDRLRSGVQECVNATGSTIDVELTTQLLRAGMHGITMLFIMGQLCYPVMNRERLTQEMIEKLTRSLE